VDRRRKTREATAYHEAGHAVLRSHFDLPIRRVTIRCDRETAGKVEGKGALYLRGIDIEITPAKQERIFRRIMVCLAGEVAQAKFSKRSVRNWHASSDHQKAADFALRVSGDDEGAALLLRWLMHRTKNMVEVRWPQIQKLASALLEREVLSGDEVRELIWGGDAGGTR
jgi:ATP-dependent Zn protease